MTRNVFDSLLEAAARHLEQPEPPAPEPASEPPRTPEPPGLDDLPPESPFGTGEAGYRRWQAANLARQAAEFRARGALPAEQPEPERLAVAFCGGKRVEVRRDGTRWALYVGEPPKRVEPFATPFYSHAVRTAEFWFGRPMGGWTFD